MGSRPIKNTCCPKGLFRLWSTALCDEGGPAPPVTMKVLGESSGIAKEASRAWRLRCCAIVLHSLESEEVADHIR